MPSNFRTQSITLILVLCIFTLPENAGAQNHWLSGSFEYGNVDPDYQYKWMLHDPHYKSGQLFLSALRKQVKDDLKGAIEDYLAAIKIEDKDPALHWYLGTAYRAAGQTEQADRQFEIERTMKYGVHKVRTYPGGYGNESWSGSGYRGFDGHRSYVGDFGWWKH